MNIDCAQAGELISRQLDGELSSVDRAKLGMHLENCDACRHSLDEYARITAPTIVVAHEGDPLHPVRAARLLAERIPHSELIVAPEPGYWVDHPEAFLEKMLGWLERLG